MLSKSVAKHLISLIELHAQAEVRVYVASKFTPNTNAELDEKHNAIVVKSALYRFIDDHTRN